MNYFLVEKRILILLWSFLYAGILFGQEQKIDLSCQDCSLETVLDELESEYGFLFSYAIENVEGKQVNIQVKEKDIDSILTLLLENTDLDFELLDSNYIVIHSKALPGPDASNSVQLCGRIVSEANRLPLQFANIYLAKKGSGKVTDEKGMFRFTVDSQADDFLIISYVGYKEKKIPLKEILSKDCPDISLELLVYDENLIIILDYLSTGIDLDQASSLIELRPRKIAALPGQTEPDVLKTIQFLPGVSSPNGAADNICIRGGTPDQNLILWEHIPIYHAAHYFGMISAFNPSIISRTEVHRGNFSAEQGGRIAGLIKLYSDAELSDQFEQSLGSNLTHAFASTKIKSANEKLMLAFSIRHALPNSWRTPTFTSISQRILQGELLQFSKAGQLPSFIQLNDNYKFVDTHLKLEYQISKAAKITAAGFYGDNVINATIKDTENDFEQIDSLFLQNSGLSLNWNHRWNKNFYSDFTMVHSNYAYEYDYRLESDQGNSVDKSGEKQSKIIEKQIRWTGNYEAPIALWGRSISPKLSMGYQYTNYDLEYLIGRGDGRETPASQLQAAQSDLHVLFANFNAELSKKTGIEAGLRYSYFQAEETSYLEPRMNLWYRPAKALTLSVQAGRYHQFITQIIEIDGDRSTIATPIWTLAGQKDVPVLQSDKVQLGAIFRKDKWLFDLQVYKNRVDGLTSLATGFDEDLSRSYNLGEADIFGVDFLVRKKWKNYQSWLSYSYIKNQDTFNRFFDKTFPSSLEQPHSLHWVNLFNYKAFEFSLACKLASGTPYSNLDYFQVVSSGQNSSQESISPIVNSFNSERLPFRHHVDASFSYRFSPKNTWKGIIGLSLFNIYNQKNLYQRNFFLFKQKNQTSNLLYSDKADLGFTPNLMFKIQW